MVFIKDFIRAPFSLRLRKICDLTNWQIKKEEDRWKIK